MLLYRGSKVEEDNFMSALALPSGWIGKVAGSTPRRPGSRLGLQMSQRTFDRLGAVSGIVGVVMGPIGFSLFGSSALGDSLNGVSTQSLAAAIAAPVPAQAFLGNSLDVLSSCLLIVFAARLWARLRRAEGSPGWLSMAALAGFVLGIAASLADKIAYSALAAQAGHGLDVQEAITLRDVAMGSANLGFLYIGMLFLGCAAGVGLRAHAFPGWLSWGAAVIALVNLISLLVPPTIAFPRLGFPLLFVWLLAASLVMLIRPENPAVAAGSSTLAAARA